MTFFQEVGQRIMDVLQEKEITQQDLANRLGVSKQVINKILHGDKNTTILEITKIARALSVPVERLLDVENKAMFNPADLDFVPLFMGQVTTEAGREGIEKARKIIELILDHKTIHERITRKRMFTEGGAER